MDALLFYQNVRGWSIFRGLRQKTVKRCQTDKFADVNIMNDKTYANKVT